MPGPGQLSALKGTVRRSGAARGKCVAHSEAVARKRTHGLWGTMGGRRETRKAARACAGVRRCPHVLLRGGGIRERKLETRRRMQRTSAGAGSGQGAPEVGIGAGTTAASAVNAGGFAVGAAFPRGTVTGKEPAAVGYEGGSVALLEPRLDSVSANEVEISDQNTHRTVAASKLSCAGDAGFSADQCLENMRKSKGAAGNLESNVNQSAMCVGAEGNKVGEGENGLGGLPASSWIAHENVKILSSSNFASASDIHMKEEVKDERVSENKEQHVTRESNEDGNRDDKKPKDRVDDRNEDSTSKENTSEEKCDENVTSASRNTFPGEEDGDKFAEGDDDEDEDGDGDSDSDHDAEEEALDEDEDIDSGGKEDEDDDDYEDDEVVDGDDADEEEEEDDLDFDDEVIPKKKFALPKAKDSEKIRVGDAYQAEIPEFLGYDAPQPNVDDHVILGIPEHCSALSDKELIVGEPFTPMERTLFEKALYEHGADFHQIAKYINRGMEAEDISKRPLRKASLCKSLMGSMNPLDSPPLESYEGGNVHFQRMNKADGHRVVQGASPTKIVGPTERTARMCVQYFYDTFFLSRGFEAWRKHEDLKELKREREARDKERMAAKAARRLRRINAKEAHEERARAMRAFPEKRRGRKPGPKPGSGRRGRPPGSGRSANSSPVMNRRYKQHSNVTLLLRKKKSILYTQISRDEKPWCDAFCEYMPARSTDIPEEDLLEHIKENPSTIPEDEAMEEVINEVKSGVEEQKKLEEKEEERHCVCDGIDQGFMVLCEKCNKWFHTICVGLRKDMLSDGSEFTCCDCAPERPELGGMKSPELLHPATWAIKLQRGEAPWITVVADGDLAVHCVVRPDQHTRFDGFARAKGQLAFGLEEKFSGAPEFCEDGEADLKFDLASEMEALEGDMYQDEEPDSAAEDGNFNIVKSGQVAVLDAAPIGRNYILLLGSRKVPIWNREKKQLAGGSSAPSVLQLPRILRECKEIISWHGAIRRNCIHKNYLAEKREKRTVTVKPIDELEEILVDNKRNRKRRRNTSSEEDELSLESPVPKRSPREIREYAATKVTEYIKSIPSMPVTLPHVPRRRGRPKGSSKKNQKTGTTSPAGKNKAVAADGNHARLENRPMLPDPSILDNPQALLQQIQYLPPDQQSYLVNLFQERHLQQLADQERMEIEMRLEEDILRGLGMDWSQIQSLPTEIRRALVEKKLNEVLSKESQLHGSMGGTFHLNHGHQNHQQYSGMLQQQQQQHFWNRGGSSQSLHVPSEQARIVEQLRNEEATRRIHQRIDADKHKAITLARQHEADLEFMSANQDEEMTALINKMDNNSVTSISDHIEIMKLRMKHLSSQKNLFQTHADELIKILASAPTEIYHDPSQIALHIQKAIEIAQQKAQECTSEQKTNERQIQQMQHLKAQQDHEQEWVDRERALLRQLMANGQGFMFAPTNSRIQHQGPLHGSQMDGSHRQHGMGMHRQHPHHQNHHHHDPRFGPR